MIYQRRDLELLEDRYENEFVLSVLTNEEPRELNHMLEAKPETIFKDYWEKQYSFVILFSNFMLAKLGLEYLLLKKNNSFSLISISRKNNFNKILSILREYEYVNGFCFFMIKSLDGLNFELAIDSQERVKVTQLSNNEIVIFQFDVEEVILIKY
ncbi:hypothetical protein M2M59_10750 [Rummeliibacillus sp. G93]|uniref:hypothetical protein n=1 Tax=Rummeliibacillus sp. G93 TaxID=2939494 RepID=UPI00201C6B71|nr:hypothetical protein [Rummeliibacillus sp. G93]UQW96467.1 hypothetical protein M2M59_10750 [Rummeliibacillus sp. G93]